MSLMEQLEYCRREVNKWPAWKRREAGLPEQPDYKGVRVRKAWGFEYELFANADVAVWHLTIKAGHRTSLHMHPKKKTALIVLKGIAAVTIGLRGGAKNMTAGDEVMIRSGCWHGTKAIGDVELLEIETPPDKSDLVRLEDDYGRAGKPYEGGEALEPFDAPNLNKSIELGNCELTKWSGFDESKEGQKLSEFNGFERNSALVFLEGGVRAPVCGSMVLGPGDVTSAKTLAMLAAKFEPLPSIVLEVRLAT